MASEGENYNHNHKPSLVMRHVAIVQLKWILFSVIDFIGEASNMYIYIAEPSLKRRIRFIETSVDIRTHF